MITRTFVCPIIGDGGQSGPGSAYRPDLTGVVHPENGDPPRRWTCSIDVSEETGAPLNPTTVVTAEFED